MNLWIMIYIGTKKKDYLKPPNFNIFDIHFY